jgi:hypothetical protein
MIGTDGLFASLRLIPSIWGFAPIATEQPTFMIGRFLRTTEITALDHNSAKGADNIPSSALQSGVDRAALLDAEDPDITVTSLATVEVNFSERAKTVSASNTGKVMLTCYSLRFVASARQGLASGNSYGG